MMGTRYLATVTGESNTTTKAGIWVGLDGTQWSTSPACELVQAGTGQESSDIGGMSFSGYYVWTDFFVSPDPHPQPEQRIPNFTINPGNEICVTVGIGYQDPARLDLRVPFIERLRIDMSWIVDRVAVSNRTAPTRAPAHCTSKWH